VGPGNPGPADAAVGHQGHGIEVVAPSPTKWNKRLHLLGAPAWAAARRPAHEFRPQCGGSDSWVVAERKGGGRDTDTGHAAGRRRRPDESGRDRQHARMAAVFSNRYSLDDHKNQALAAAYYGEPASTPIGTVVSTGGRQGMKQAQVYQRISTASSPRPGDQLGAIHDQPNLSAGGHPARFGWGAPDGGSVVRRALAAISACDLVGGTPLAPARSAAVCV